MNKEEVLQLNVIPDGKEPWLSYDNYLELKKIFESVNVPSSNKDIVDSEYVQLDRFLRRVDYYNLSENL